MDKAALNALSDDPELVKQLALTLANVPRSEEAELLTNFRSTNTIARAMRITRSHDDLGVLQNALGALANLAYIGGLDVVKEHGGFTLMLESLRSPVFNVQYFAAAGVQNMLMDKECREEVIAREHACGSKHGLHGLSEQPSATPGGGGSYEPAIAAMSSPSIF